MVLPEVCGPGIDLQPTSAVPRHQEALSLDQYTQTASTGRISGTGPLQLALQLQAATPCAPHPVTAGGAVVCEAAV